MNRISLISVVWPQPQRIRVDSLAVECGGGGEGNFFKHFERGLLHIYKEYIVNRRSFISCSLASATPGLTASAEKLSEGLIRFELAVPGDLERRGAPPSFL